MSKVTTRVGSAVVWPWHTQTHSPTIV